MFAPTELLPSHDNSAPSSVPKGDPLYFFLLATGIPPKKLKNIQSLDKSGGRLPCPEGFQNSVFNWDRAWQVNLCQSPHPPSIENTLICKSPNKPWFAGDVCYFRGRIRRHQAICLQAICRIFQLSLLTPEASKAQGDHRGTNVRSQATCRFRTKLLKPSDHLLRGRIYGMMGDNTDRNRWYNVDLMGI